MMPEISNAVPLVDLRSDTVTKPTPAMLERMMRAELGDDGRGDDPTVKELEKVAAERLGKEAGLFLPSGTMSNQVAILTHARIKGEVIGEATSHIFRSELGGLSLIAGLYPRPLPGKRGAMDTDSLRSSLRPPEMTANALGTAVVCMETTHNAAGGSVLPLGHMREVYSLCVHRGVPVHLDGARIFNAALAQGVPASAIAVYADSVTFCLSKGLSAPVGSVLTAAWISSSAREDFAECWAEICDRPVCWPPAASSPSNNRSIGSRRITPTRGGSPMVSITSNRHLSIPTRSRRIS